MKTRLITAAALAALTLTNPPVALAGPSDYAAAAEVCKLLKSGQSKQQLAVMFGEYAAKLSQLTRQPTTGMDLVNLSINLGCPELRP